MLPKKVMDNKNTVSTAIKPFVILMCLNASVYHIFEQFPLQQILNFFDRLLSNTSTTVSERCEKSWPRGMTADETFAVGQRYRLILPEALHPHPPTSASLWCILSA